MQRQPLKYLAVLLMLGACAQTTRTSGTSYIDPDYRGGTFNSVVVDAQTNSLSERIAIEHAAAARLNAAGIKAYAGSDVVPPTRSTGETAMRRAFMNTGAAGVIEIMPTQKYIDREYIPGTYRGPRYHGSPRQGNFYYEPGFYDPGMVLEEPHARYDVRLSTLPKYKTVWTGEFETVGPTGMDFTEVSARFGQGLVERLGKDGLIALPAK